MSRRLHRVRHYFTKHSKVLLTSVAVIALFTVTLLSGYYLIKGPVPYASELAFTEHSVLGKEAGSVIPASCVSGTHYQHAWGYNNDGSIDEGCMPVCGANQSVAIAYTEYRCSSYKDVNGYYEMTEVTNYPPTA